MVKITFLAWEEVVVHELSQHEPQDLYTLVIRQALADGTAALIPPLYWANGIAFAISFFPDTEEIIREKLKGIMHCAALRFALVGEHRPEVWLNLSGAEYRIRLQNAASNPVFAELTQALKKRAGAASAV